MDWELLILQPSPTAMGVELDFDTKDGTHEDGLNQAPRYKNPNIIIEVPVDDRTRAAVDRALFGTN